MRRQSEITSDVTWNDGETYGGMSISGTTVITVNGTVNIDSTISISGNVTIKGGGTLKAAASGTTLISVAENATLTLADITIDGNNSAAAMAVYGGKVFIKDGASISNCKKTSRAAHWIYPAEKLQWTAEELPAAQPKNTAVRCI